MGRHGVGSEVWNNGEKTMEYDSKLWTKREVEIPNYNKGGQQWVLRSCFRLDNLCHVSMLSKVRIDRDLL